LRRHKAKAVAGWRYSADLRMALFTSLMRKTYPRG